MREREEIRVCQPKLKLEKRGSKQDQGGLMSLEEKKYSCFGEGKMVWDLHAPSCSGWR